MQQFLVLSILLAIFFGCSWVDCKVEASGASGNAKAYRPNARAQFTGSLNLNSKFTALQCYEGGRVKGVFRKHTNITCNEKCVKMTAEIPGQPIVTMKGCGTCEQLDLRNFLPLPRDVSIEFDHECLECDDRDFCNSGWTAFASPLLILTGAFVTVLLTTFAGIGCV